MRISSEEWLSLSETVNSKVGPIIRAAHIGTDEEDVSREVLATDAKRINSKDKNSVRNLLAFARSTAEREAIKEIKRLRLGRSRFAYTDTLEESSCASQSALNDRESICVDDALAELPERERIAILRYFRFPNADPAPTDYRAKDRGLRRLRSIYRNKGLL